MGNDCNFSGFILPSSCQWLICMARVGILETISSKEGNMNVAMEEHMAVKFISYGNVHYRAPFIEE